MNYKVTVNAELNSDKYKVNAMPNNQFVLTGTCDLKFAELVVGVEIDNQFYKLEDLGMELVVTNIEVS